MNGSTYLILLAVFLFVIIPWISKKKETGGSQTHFESKNAEQGEP